MSKTDAEKLERKYVLARAVTKDQLRHGKDDFIRLVTCHFYPEETQGTYFDEDDNEVELVPPRTNDDGSLGYDCSNCGGAMMNDWFDERKADDGHGYVYYPRFSFCPYCGGLVIPEHFKEFEE